MTKLVWIRLDGAPAARRKELARSALEQGFRTIIMGLRDCQALGSLGKYDQVVIRGEELTLGARTGKFVTMGNRSDVERATGLAGKVDWVVVAARDWKIIPIEGLIAHYQGTRTKLLAQVTSASDAKVFFETLEKGVDGVVFDIRDPNELAEAVKLLSRADSLELPVAQAKVIRVASLGSGDRVCVDTCTLLRVGEGMLIGSQASSMFLVHSETKLNQYAEPRPFRVNAGAVHSYILMADRTTKYLSELVAGDEVLAADVGGRTQNVVVGRAKIEKRPLVLVEAETGQRKFNVILQNAETVCLVRDGEPVSIVEIRAGDSVAVWTGDGKGRHFGKSIKENILEK
jgi:3-dehydroquinate synthase II